MCANISIHAQQDTGTPVIIPRQPHPASHVQFVQKIIAVGMEQPKKICALGRLRKTASKTVAQSQQMPIRIPVQHARREHAII